MATENLQVKFKVDTSEVKSGADEAKNKVKQAAQSMEGDVKKASSSMSNSLKEISRSTDQIGQSARKATSDLGNMEGQLKNVSRQMSAMQMFNMGARGVGMLSGVASNVLKLQGDYEGAEKVQTAGQVVGGAFQGAAMGFAVGGPWGAAIGGLVGAGSALLDAAVKQKEAAAALLKSSTGTIEGIEERYQDRVMQESIAQQSRAKDFDSDAAMQQIRDARLALKNAQLHQADIQDVLYGRREGIYDPSEAFGLKPGSMKSYRTQMNWMDQDTRDAFTQSLKDQGMGGAESFVSKQYQLFAEEAKNAEKEVERAQKLLAMLAPLQARIDAEQQKATERWMNGNAEFWKAFDDYQSGKTEKEELGNQLKEGQRTLAGYQSQLQGVISKPAQSPTDALTRIGGGRGYTAYNNSTANIQKSIESNLRQLIKNQEAQNQQIIDRLEALNQNPTQATWAS